MLLQIPAPFNLEAVMKSKQDDPSALHVVLFQEVCRAKQQAPGGCLVGVTCNQGSSNGDGPCSSLLPASMCWLGCCCPVFSHVQIERYNALLVQVRRSCAELVKGIKGLVVMSADLDEVRRGQGQGLRGSGCGTLLELQH